MSAIDWYRVSSTSSTSGYYNNERLDSIRYEIEKDMIEYPSPLSELTEMKVELNNTPKKEINESKEEQELLFDPEELDL